MRAECRLGHSGWAVVLGLSKWKIKASVITQRVVYRHKIWIKKWKIKVVCEIFIATQRTVLQFGNGSGRRVQLLGMRWLQCAAAVAAATATDDDFLLHSIRRWCCGDNKDIQIGCNLLTIDPRVGGSRCRLKYLGLAAGPCCNLNRTNHHWWWWWMWYYQRTTDRTIIMGNEKW